jgi:NAD(P)-dependent dehydrogenase (short-subunit alcohol dehydrogenase family)
MRLRDKAAIVTGAASGIGRATALLFAAEGARLLLVDRDEAALAALEREIDNAGGRHHCAPGDVVDEAFARASVDRAAASFGRVDVLMTAAGISLGKPAHETPLQSWNEVMSVNVTGTFLWIREALRPMMRQRSGAIVTVASQLARAGGRNNAAYVASKGAVAALTREVAVDYAPWGIRCNALLPGATETPMLQRSFGRAADPAATRERSRLRHAMERFGRPQEIAQAALYLASDEASFTTGIELPVDGGWLAA